jgi:hypothetical protein
VLKCAFAHMPVFVAYRRFLILLSSLTAMLVAVLGFGAAQAQAQDVLSVGSAGGTDAAVNDVLTAGLASGTSATFASGFVNITCAASTFTGSVSTNPAAPGTATVSGTSLTFGGGAGQNTCTSNLGAVTTSVVSPGSTSVSSSNTATINGTDVRFTVFGTTCEYKATSTASDTGTTSNTDNSISYTSIPVTLQAGSGGFCSSTGTETVKYAPVVDTSQANQKVFVNAAPQTAICNGTSTGTGTKCPTNNTYFLYGIDINANDVINGSVASDSPHLNGNGKITFTDSNDGTQTITCNSSLTTKQNSDGTSNNGVKNISFSDCTTTITGCTFGTMGSNNTPYTSTITAVAKQSWEATMVIKSVNITYGLTCGGTGQSCTLTTSMLTGHVFNPSNPLKETKDASGALDISDSLTNGAGDGTKCLKSPTFDATYDLTDSGGGNVLVNPPAA